MLDATDFLLVNPWQRGFPLAPRPFAALADRAGVSEDEALERLARLREQGVIDRIGPVFRPLTVGASTLAAMAVPPQRLEQVAAFVTQQAGVNHNYEREHRVNLWFVATGATAEDVQRTLGRIEDAAGLAVLRMPLVEEYHIDLGFDLDSLAAPRTAARVAPVALTEPERRVVSGTAAGLPLVAAPYAALAQQLGMAEDEVIALLQRMLDDGRIRRMGAVVRHRRLGFEANAMAVWDVPDAEVRALGEALARDSAVTLCYRRARALPDWPYNLYCMVHGRERGRTVYEVKRIGMQHGLGACPRALLFSRRCFSQRAARYG